MPLDPAVIQAITSFVSVAGPFIGFSARPLYDRWMAKTEAQKVKLLADANAYAKKADAEAEVEAEHIKAVKRQETERPSFSQSSGADFPSRLLKRLVGRAHEDLVLGAHRA